MRPAATTDQVVRVSADLGLTEARRAVDDQAAVLEGLRARAGNLLGVSAAVSALFVGLSDGYNWATVAGLTCLGLGAIVIMRVLAPVTMHLAIGPEAIMRAAGRVQDPAHLVESLAAAHWRDYEANADVLRRRHRHYFLCLCLFVAQVIALAASHIIDEGFWR